MSKTAFNKWMFKSPAKSDWAFNLWLGISLLASVAIFIQNLTRGQLGIGSSMGVVSGLLDGLFTFFGNFIIWYVISLLWLVPRRLLSISGIGNTSEVVSTEAPINLKNVADQSVKRINFEKIRFLPVAMVVLLLMALTLPYTDSQDSLVSEPANLYYNLLPFVLFIFVTVNFFKSLKFEISLSILLPLLYWHTQGNVSNLGLWISGITTPKAGAYSETLFFLLLILFVYIAIRNVKKDTTFTKEKLIIATIGSVIALTYVAASWFNWTLTKFEITKSEQVWKSNNKAVETDECCHLFDRSSTAWIMRDFVLVFGLFVVLYFCISYLSIDYVGYSMISLGFVLSSSGLSWLMNVFPENINPLTQGFSQAKIDELGLQITRTPLAGGWVALLSSLLFVFLGLFITANNKLKTSNEKLI